MSTTDAEDSVGPKPPDPASTDPAALRLVAESLATEAAAFVRRRRPEVFGAQASETGAVRVKSSPTDPVTVVDTETEALLRRRIAELRPDDLILGEEGGGPTAEQAGRTGAITWVLDPVDGTVNFVYGIPAYAVSVAARLDGISVAGAVADVVGERVYSAGVGLGAHVTDADGTAELHCSDIDELSVSLLGTGFGYSAHRRQLQASLLAGILPRVRDVRRMGSAALDLCMVGAGRLDIYYEHGIKAWDYAAGVLIAAEAGARVRLEVADAGDPAGVAAPILAVAPGIAEEFTDLLESLDGLSPIPE